MFRLARVLPSRASSGARHTLGIRSLVISHSLRPGLTLVELLVALALTLFMMSLFIGMVVWAANGTRTMKGITSIDQKIRTVSTILRRDLEHVYLANGGEPIPVSELFTRGPELTQNAAIAAEGYFEIEENSRALRQGLDAWGQPAEVDTDDVLAFTVRLAGSRPEEIFYGRVTQGVCLDESGASDLGRFLDNQSRRPPVARFDATDNGTFTSRFAEVIYYLRPTGAQYSVNQLRAADPANPALPGTQVPTLPPLYNLYRRQLLVLGNDDAELVNRGSTLVPNGFLFPRDLIDKDGDGNTAEPLSFYDVFDISASREFDDRFDSNADGIQDTTLWLFGAPPQYRLHFNTLADLSRRERRYGMRLIELDNPAHAYQVANMLPVIAPRYIYRAVPLSHALAGGAAPQPATPAVHHYTMHQWFGRPNLAESANQAYPFAPVVSYAAPPSAGAPIGTVDMSDVGQNGQFDAYESIAPGQRAGDDLLLTNVVSFDIKVLEDFSGVVAAVNPLRDFDFSGAGQPAPQRPTVLPRQRRGEFIDLGYYADLTNPEGIAAGPDRNTNVIRANAAGFIDVYSYVGHPTFAPFGVQLNFGLEPFAAPTATTTTHLGYGPDGKPGRAGVDDNGDTTVDDFGEYMTAGSDDYSVADLTAFFARLKGPDGAWGVAGVDDDANGTADDYLDYPWIDPAYPRVPRWLGDDLNPYVHALAGDPLDPVPGDGGWGTALTNDDSAAGDVSTDDIHEYLWPGTNDVPFNVDVTAPATVNKPTGALFGRSGQVATNVVTGNTPPASGLWNPGNTNPRNTFDSWSAAYDSRPIVGGESTDAFRPVPYPRPIKALQIKLRVLEPKSGIVREVTIVHKFK